MPGPGASTTETYLRFAQTIIALLLLAALVTAYALGVPHEQLPAWLDVVVGLLLGWLGLKRPSDMAGKRT